MMIRHEKMKFDAQVKETHEKYQKALEACNKIIDWPDSLQTFPTPETFPMYLNE